MYKRRYEIHSKECFRRNKTILTTSASEMKKWNVNWIFSFRLQRKQLVPPGDIRNFSHFAILYQDLLNTYTVVIKKYLLNKLFQFKNLFIFTRISRITISTISKRKLFLFLNFFHLKPFQSQTVLHENSDHKSVRDSALFTENN